MSEKMTDEAKAREEEAREKGTSLGEEIAKEFGPKGLRSKPCAAALLAKVAERLDAGDEAGVALYEALDYFASGQYRADAAREAAGAVAAAEKAGIKFDYGTLKDEISKPW